MHKFKINCNCFGELDNKIISSAYAKAPESQLPKDNLNEIFLDLLVIYPRSSKKILVPNYCFDDNHADLLLQNCDMLFPLEIQLFLFLYHW